MLSGPNATVDVAPDRVVQDSARRSGFHDVTRAAFQAQHRVDVAEGLRPVGDQQRSAAHHQAVEGEEHGAFRGGVEPLGGLVQDEDRGVLQKRPRDGDPKVRATVERVDKVLRLNGLVHRFVPEKTPGRPDQPLGDREGAFLMCTMWLAEAWQMLEKPERAKRALERAEACRGTNRLFSEAGDARHPPGLLGNMPLLFTEAAYARAAMAVG